ncbi:hypothetical protein BH10BAC2_BH10BAC2_14420 [soil metagenome]
MKKLSSIFVGIALLLLAVAANAQSKIGADYFKGKWSLLLKGLPDGDTKMIFLLENRNDSIAGVVQDSTGAEIAKITSVELKDTEITLYFTTQGYDVNLLMTKKDDDHTTGSLMSMFDAEGERIKVIK